MKRLFCISLLLFVFFSCSQQEKMPFLIHETFESNSAENWQPNVQEDWQLIEKEGNVVYELSKTGSFGEIRKPTSIAILKPFIVGDFELEVMAKCYTDTSIINRDICLFYGYQDSLHFYYTHFSANSDNVHNIIGIVNNADRKKINIEPAGSSVARFTGDGWYKLKVRRSLESGLIECFIEDMTKPIVTVIDTTFKYGRVGIGSFDDTGAFDDIKLWGQIK
jgi:hypothetical protein